MMTDMGLASECQRGQALGGDVNVEVRGGGTLTVNSFGVPDTLGLRASSFSPPTATFPCPRFRDQRTEAWRE